MSVRFLRRRAWRPALLFLALVLVLLRLPVFGAERGFPLITVYPAEVHKAGPQTFDLAQDSRGILYFGNLHGLVTYDGAWWHLTKLPAEQVALSVAADARGRLALGLVNDFGYITPGVEGSHGFHSLLAQVPQAQREFGDVRAICSTNAGFLYLTERSMFLWNDGAPRLVGEFPADAAPRGCHARGNEVFLRTPKGLQRLDLASMRIEPIGTDKSVHHIVERQDGKLVLALKDEGLALLDQGTLAPFAPEANTWLKGKVVSGGCTLRDGRLVITTRQHGLIVLAADGTVEQIIREDAGLPDAILNEARVDREGSLWLAMEGPIVRIDLGSTVTLFDSRLGVRGSGADVARIGDRLFVATTHGLYEIPHRGDATRVEGLAEGGWRMLTIGGELLVGAVKGIYRLGSDGKLAHIVETESEVYDLHQSRSDPNRIWLAMGDGIGSIRRDGATWKFEGLVRDVPAYISTVVERDGVLWAGTVFNGIARIEAPLTPKQRVTMHGTGEMNVYDTKARVVLVRATGAVVELGPKGDLVPDHLLGHIKTPRGFFVVVEDPRGDIWINSTPPRVFEKQRDGTYAREGRPLVSITAADIQNLRATPDGVVWFASDKGVFRYQPGSAEVHGVPNAPLIRRAIAGENRLLFASGTVSDPAKLRHNFGRIRIEFASASYLPGVMYQYRLDPIDANWSAWTTEPFIDYTTLEASDYTFRVRTRGAALLPSGETNWSFTVAPPWYRTTWAYALWVLLALAAILAVIRVRTGTLRRQAEKLKVRVAEQTAELQETVKLLEAANTQLEALSLEDDLTGIANRRSFERALLDEWNRGRRHELPLALILLDLDHFKDLNDRRGHPAGDDCLRRVGRFLAETIKRTGEVVARYGGEEFAILLPAVDASSAIRVAESLRDGIEKLGIPYGNGQGKRVTGSCGVAAMTPSESLTPESLVASADRALYAAKHSGRNCVRVADETTTGTWLRDVSAS
ncbi:MAG TPA: diguanylate cyclase [Thermoanaerobaculia bacterium]|nr:diguanylate cyclase [Thermoanaerobaculia bacterium]